MKWKGTNQPSQAPLDFSCCSQIKQTEEVCGSQSDAMVHHDKESMVMELEAVGHNASGSREQRMLVLSLFSPFSSVQEIIAHTSRVALPTLMILI